MGFAFAQPILPLEHKVHRTWRRNVLGAMIAELDQIDTGKEIFT
jgi:hypothetical protein